MQPATSFEVGSYPRTARVFAALGFGWLGTMRAVFMAVALGYAGGATDAPNLQSQPPQAPQPPQLPPPSPPFPAVADALATVNVYLLSGSTVAVIADGSLYAQQLSAKRPKSPIVGQAPAVLRRRALRARVQLCCARALLSETALSTFRSTAARVRWFAHRLAPRMASSNSRISA